MRVSAVNVCPVLIWSELFRSLGMESQCRNVGLDFKRNEQEVSLPNTVV